MAIFNNIYNRITGNKDTLVNIQSQATGRYALNANSDSVEIDILDEIDDWWGYGVRQMAYDLSLHSGQDLTIRVHSPGGLVTEGVGIANLIKAHQGTTTTKGVGFVASIATAILLSADKVTMSNNAWFMIHKPWSSMWGGESEDFRQQADLLDKMEGQLVDIYVTQIEGNGKLINNSREETAEQVRTWMAAETWFTAAEALEHGFIDEIVDATDYVSETNARAVMAQLKDFKAAPAALMNSIQSFQANDMSKKKGGLLEGLRNLLNQHGDTPAPAAEAETETVETVETDSSEAIEAARQLLESQGFQVAEAETETEEVEEEVEATEEVEGEQDTDIQALIAAEVRNQMASIQSNRKPKAKKKGLPSTSTTPPKTDEDRIAPYDKDRAKQFDGFAKYLIDRAKRG